MDLAEMPSGKRSVALPMCKQCAEYILDDLVPCPHCDAPDPRAPGGRYKEEGFYARDAMEKLIEVMDRAMTRQQHSPPQNGD